MKQKVKSKKPFKVGLLTSFLLLSSYSYAQELDAQPPLELEPPHEGASTEWTKIYWGFLDTFYPSPKPEGILDEDGDSISNEIELALELDPNDPQDAGQDADLDQLNLAEELYLGTDDSKVDSNGNGISDWDEIFIHRTNPMEAVVKAAEPALLPVTVTAAAESALPPIEQPKFSALPTITDFDKTARNTKRNQEGKFEWTRHATEEEGWQAHTGTTIEAWNKGVFELNGSKTNYGLKQTFKATTGTYKLSWEHRGRMNKKTVDNSYTLKVTKKIDDESSETILESIITAPIQKSLTDHSISFAVDNGDTEVLLAGQPATTSEVTISLTPSNASNTLGSLIADIKLQKTFQLAVKVIELSPKVKDEDGNDISGSEKPSISNPLSPFVEINPHANKIAHRELKVKIGKPLKGKKVTWTLEALPGTSPATIRGGWADSPTHKDRFEASSAYGANGYKRISQQSGETTIAEDGHTAIRVNVPPIGFNQVRIKIQIEGVGTPIELIDMEVPGIVVIDPGHGGTDSGAVGRTDNSVEEADLVLAYGLDLKTQIEKKFNAEKRNHKVVMTRDTDTFISLTARAPVARDNGADIFVSLHFNAATATTARGTETFVERTAATASPGNPGANVNVSEDEALANSLNSTTLAAVKASDAGAKDRGVKRAGKAVTRDGETRNGNIQGFHPVKACLIEVEFLSHATALDTIKLSTQTGVAIKDKFAEDAAKDIFYNIKNQQ